MKNPHVILGISGASGAALGVLAAQHLATLGAQIHLVCSPAAHRTIGEECAPGTLPRLEQIVTQTHPATDIGATIASGSFPVAGMIVAPCSMRSLAAIAHGLDDNLLTRAASVQLKERRPLILLTREAPLTLAHLQNMTAITQMGGIIMPPVPAFYLKPETVEDMTRQIAARAVDMLRLGERQAAAWSPV